MANKRQTDRQAGQPKMCLLHLVAVGHHVGYP